MSEIVLSDIAEKINPIIDGSETEYSDFIIEKCTDQKHFDLISKIGQYLIEDKSFIAGGKALEIYTYNKYPAGDIDLYTDVDTCYEILQNDKQKHTEYMLSESIIMTRDLQILILPKLVLGKTTSILRSIALMLNVYDINVCKIAIYVSGDDYYFCKHKSFDVNYPVAYSCIFNKDHIDRYINVKGFTNMQTICIGNGSEKKYENLNISPYQSYKSIMTHPDDACIRKRYATMKKIEPENIKALNGTSLYVYNLSKLMLKVDLKDGYLTPTIKLNKSKEIEKITLNFEFSSYAYLYVHNSTFEIMLTDDAPVKSYVMKIDISQLKFKDMTKIIDHLSEKYELSYQSGHITTFNADKPVNAFNDFMAEYMKTYEIK
jgi:hypothetical protein